jgi:hypothetical protein
VAWEAYARLTARVVDDSADRHNLSQGFWDPVLALTSGDPLYGGNVPYTIEGMPVADRLSFYFASKCDIGVPGGVGRARSEDMRLNGCSADSSTGNPQGGSSRGGGGSLSGLELVIALLIAWCRSDTTQ